mgnify:CR=1 FL=1
MGGASTEAERGLPVHGLALARVAAGRLNRKVEVEAEVPAGALLPVGLDLHAVPSDLNGVVRQLVEGKQ